MTATPARAEPASRGTSRLDGWRVVIAGFLGLTLINGVRACFGLFLPFMVADIGFSLSFGSAVFWLHWTGYSVGCVLLGNFIDRAGVPPRLVRVGAAVYAAGLLLVPVATAGLQVMLLFGLLGGLGGAVMGSVPTNVSVSWWFIERRGIALGITNTGVGFGVTVLPLLAGGMVALAGWRSGWLALGALAAVVMIPLGGWFATPPPVEGEAASAPPGTVRRIFRSLSFWSLALAFALGLVAQYGTAVHLPGQALALGIPATRVATGMMFGGIANIAARIGFGWLADRIPDRTFVVLPGTALFVTGVLLASTMATERDFYVAAMLAGAGTAVYGPLYGMITADRFPKEVLGRIFGALTLGAGVGGAGGPVLVGVLLDSGATYAMVWRVTAIAAMAAVPLFFIRRAPWSPPR